MTRYSDNARTCAALDRSREFPEDPSVNLGSIEKTLQEITQAVSLEEAKSLAEQALENI